MVKELVGWGVSGTGKNGAVERLHGTKDSRINI